jgi:hypothetical protein
LRDCLESILRQTFGDFEVLVGNDCVACPLTTAELGIDDPRVRILNYPVNVGERGNLNALLAAASGEYFTWQADDDFYDPRYLEAVTNALAATPRVDAVFTGFSVLRGEGSSASVAPTTADLSPRRMSGEAFLRAYWSRDVRPMGLVGAYRTGYLRAEGGVRDLAAARIAVMSEYYLLLRASKLPVVAYIDAPLVVYRAHEASWSTTRAAAEVVERAGLSLLAEGIAVLPIHPTAAEPAAHVRGLVRLVFHDVMKTVARSMGPRELLVHGIAYMRRAQQTVDTAAEELLPARGFRHRLVLAAFLRMLPQAMLFAASPTPLRRTVQRVRGWLRGEFFQATLPQQS